VHKFTVQPLPRPDTFDPGFAEFVNNYIQEHDIACIFGDHIWAQMTVNQLGPHLGPVARFPALPAEDLAVFDDKWAFNRFLHDHNFSALPSFILRQPSDVFDPAVDTVGYPMIVKPLSEQGSDGVAKVENIGELEMHLAGDQPYNDLPLIIQKFIPGYDGGVSFLALDGRILATALQRYHWDDGTIEFFRDDEIEDFAARFAAASNYTGVANIDLRLDENNKLRGVIECNPRFWGSIVASRVHGRNFVKAGIDLALGADPDNLDFGTYREGLYYSARALVKQWLANRGTFKGIARENLAEVWPQTLDIRPHIYRRLRQN